MYLMNTRRIRRKLQKLSDDLTTNICTWMLFEGPFHNETHIANPAQVSALFEKMRTEPRDGETNVTDDHFFLMAMLQQLLDPDVMERLPVGGMFSMEVLTLMTHFGRVYHKADFESDRYLQTFSFKHPVTCGSYTLTTRPYDRYQFALDRPPLLDEDDSAVGYILPRPAAFADPYAAPCLLKDGNAKRPIRIVYPYTIQAAQPILTQASGNVLLLGCGLGYVPFHLSAKEDVQHITIVDADADLRALFEKHLLPRFPHPERIDWRTEDPQAFLRSLEDGAYDFCFVDVLQTESDLAPYLQYRKRCERFQKMTVLYRAEDFLLIKLREIISALILEAMHPEFLKDADYHPELLARDYPFFKDLTKNVRITKDQQIEELWKPETLLCLMEEPD